MALRRVPPILLTAAKGQLMGGIRADWTTMAVFLAAVELGSIAVLLDLAEARADLGLITMPGDVPAPLDARPWRTDRLAGC